jgi:cyclophilin family peptidyl-prolyl cis-trans isomerase
MISSSKAQIEMKKLVVGLLTFIMVFTSVAQNNSLAGKITDTITGLPLAGVFIYLSGHKTGTVTSTEGSYSIKELPERTYTIKVSCQGYESLTEKIHVSGPVQRNFRLTSSFLTKKDRSSDVLLQTTLGDIVVRLSDSTPLHRDNFLKLVKTGYYDSVLFHRVIPNFMIQAGDPNSKQAAPGQPLGAGGPGYRLPAEFKTTLFHKRGVIAAARDNNPEKASSGSQFYIVQGKIFTDAGLDSVETFRLNGKKIPPEQREVYKTIGGTPHLDQTYTVFGEVISGMDVVDKIAAVQTSKGADHDRPIEDVRILKAKLIDRVK